MFDPETQAALDVARGLASAGVPVFLARPVSPEDDAHWHKVGYVLPKGWQTAVPDPSVVDLWRPGMALCALMGHGLDLLDIDPRSGGQLPDTVMVPHAYAAALTPSGGFHLFVKSLGAGSRDGVFPGVDVKGGMPDGSGRGFAFIAPTVKASKVDGQFYRYTWHQPPTGGDEWNRDGDDTGQHLAAAVLAAKASSGTARPATVSADDPFAAYLNQREPHSTLVADRAIKAELDKLAAMPAQTGAGFRTAVLRAAMILGGYVGAGHILATDAHDALCEAIAGVWGTVDTDDALWIEQGLADGAAKPFAVYDPTDLDRHIPGSGVTEEQKRKWQFYDVIGKDPFDPHDDQTDQGLADAVLTRVWPGLRAGVDTGTWIERGPEVWEERGQDLAPWAISVLARLMPLGRKAEPGEDKGPEHYKFERRKLFMSSVGASRISTKMRAVATGADHPIAVRVSKLDHDPEVLWAGGVPWDLRASGERPVPSILDPGTPHLHTAACAPEIVPTPAWDAFVSTVWPDAEVRAWALRVLSISLTGYADAALPVLYGPERTGKTSLVSLLIKLLGTYAHAADPRILGGAENAHASVIYALKGRRLSFIDEGPRKGHLASERLKQITGGAELTGNAMRANPITFAPTHTLVMSTNDEPQISDAALRSRMRIIPCEGDRQAVRLAREAITPAVWESEAPGVLAAMMREASAWLDARGSALNEAAPLTVRDHNEELAREQDVFARWVEERTTPDENGTGSRVLYNAFAAWFGDNPATRRQALPSETAWGRAMTRLGYPVTHHKTGKRRPLRMTSPFDSAPVPTTPPPAATAPVTGPVAGFDGLPDGPVTPETPRSAPVSTSVSDGLTGLSRSITTTSSKDTHKNITAERGDKPVTRHQPPSSVPAAPETPAQQAGTCPVCGGQPGLTKAGARRSHKVNGIKCEGTGTRVPGFVTESQRARLEEKAATIARLAGPHLGYPAAMRRSEEPRAVDLTETASVLEACLARNSGRISLDVETNGLPPWHPEYQVRMVQLGDWAEGVALDPAVPEQQSVIRAYLAAATEIDAHSYTADLAPVARLGLGDYHEMLAKAVDTATIAKLADPASVENGDGLKELSATLLGDAAASPAAEAAKDELGKAAGWIWQLKPDTPDEKNGWRHIPAGCTTYIRYGIADVLDCAALRLKLPQPDPAVLARELAVERITAMPPFAGLSLDSEAVSAQLEDREPRAAAKLARINQLGVVNPDSSKQLTTRLTELGAILPRTKGTEKNPEGNLSAKADVLEKFRHAPGELGELATTVLEYRDDATLLKNMLRPWARSTRGGDSRTYPTIYTLGADTGRMSCVRPNLQQVSREGGLRECVLADPGTLLIAADFSSVEVRVAAAVSGDQNLIAMINGAKTCADCLAGKTCVLHDLHAMIANAVYGPGFTKANRYNVKRGVFGRFYGGGEETLANQTGIGVEMVRHLISVLDQLAPQLREWSDGVRKAIKAGMREYVTYSGRVIHLDPRFPHKGPNYIIQGTARELLVDALLRWDAGPYRGGVILPVHDEIVAMVPAEHAQEATEFLVACMTTQLGAVPIDVEADAPSDRWVSAA